MTLANISLKDRVMVSKNQAQRCRTAFLGIQMISFQPPLSNTHISITQIYAQITNKKIAKDLRVSRYSKGVCEFAKKA